MTDVTHDTGRIGLGGRNRLFAARLAVGVVQGLVLYSLYWTAEQKVWPDTQPALFGALVLTFAYAPMTLLAGAGRIGWRALGLWFAGCAVVLALLGAHDVSRQVLREYQQAPYLSLPVLAFAATALFIAHHLFDPAWRARRWVASFHDYFDTAWKAGVQLALSLGFTGAFWLLLHLGAALFRIIGLTFLDSVLSKAWFAIPVLCVAFATAVQLTDVRDGLIRGVRTVALMLLSWLLPVIALLVGAFLLALPFRGLDGLWNSYSATALVLAAAAALIVLINASYQDGQQDNLPPRALRVATRIAGGLIAPLIGLAFWGLMLRIGQHGLTPDRIIALACALVGAIYAVGYIVAAVRPGPWMRPLERTNVAAAVASVATVVALFSPLLDPARLSVADQTARLVRGVVSPTDFDYNFLAFDSGKAGRAALERLKASDDPDVARRAAEAATRDNRHIMASQDAERLVRITPAGGEPPLPDSFGAHLTRLAPQIYTCNEDAPCTARQIDLDGDGRKEVLLATAHGHILVFRQDASGDWHDYGSYAPLCGRKLGELAELFAARDVVTAPSSLPDLVLGDLRLVARTTPRCAAEDAPD